MAKSTLVSFHYDAMGQSQGYQSSSAAVGHPQQSQGHPENPESTKKDKSRLPKP
jgi:hypothetical protein